MLSSKAEAREKIIAARRVMMFADLMPASSRSMHIYQAGLASLQYRST